MTSSSSVDLSYFTGEHKGEQRGEQLSSQKILETKEGRKAPAAKPAPPSDPRFKPFLDFAYKQFNIKYFQKPSWDGKHFKALREFLKRNPDAVLDEWQRRYRNFMASTDPFYRQQSCSLLYFANNFDRFVDGPITEQGKGPNAKPTASDLARRNAKALGFN